LSEATTATAAPAQSAPVTLAERRTHLAERRQQLAEQREAREGGIDPSAGLGTGGTGLTARWGPLPVWAWMGLAIVVGALGWFIWKSRQSGSSSSSTTSSTGNCIDTSGNSVPCSQADYGGQIATLQAEIQDLQGQQGATTPAVNATVPPNQSANVAGGVQGLTATGTGPQSVLLQWQPVAGATSYAVRVASPPGALESTTSTSYLFVNLKPNTSYTFYVSAEPSTSGHSAVSAKTS
jgi:hypothetical protein